jgi:hypothetical protein
LSLEDPIDQYVKGVPNGDEITLTACVIKIEPVYNTCPART